MLRKALSTLTMFALVVGGYYLWLQQNHEPEQLSAVDSIVAIEDVQSSDGDATLVQEMSMGAEDAPVTIIEYASFTCPHCAAYHHNVFGKIVENYVDTGKVRFVMRDVYFDRFGLWAAMLARCGDGSKFFGVSDLIYTNQREWTAGDTNLEVVQNLQKLGRLAGMDETAMNACLQDNEMAQALVSAYQENAERDEISSTPTFIINGEKYPNMSYEDFKEVLDGLLNE